MRHAWMIGLIALLPQHAAAAQLSGAELSGERLFTQSCAVCHLKPNLNAGLYGPALYKDLVAGQEKAIGAFIAKGSDHMPAFRYQFSARQIAAIVDYLKTIPAPDQTAAPAPPRRAGQVD